MSDDPTIALIVAGISGGVTLFGILLSNKKTRESIENQTKAINSQKHAVLLSSFEVIMDWIGNPAIRSKRKFLWTSTTFIDLAKKFPADIPSLPTITDWEEERARDVAVAYDKVGFIIRWDDYLKEEFLKWHGLVVIEMWKRLSPFVLKKWKIGNGKLDGFQYLYEEAEKLHNPKKP